MRARGIAAGLLIASLSLGCSGGSSEQSATVTTPDAARTTTVSDPTGDAHASLCATRAAARAGDLDAARRAFDHGPLHELADALLDADRTAAARLLEAKEAVESDLTDDATPPAQVASDLDTLIHATNAALAATNKPNIAPCEQENP